MSVVVARAPAMAESASKVMAPSHVPQRGNSGERRGSGGQRPSGPAVSRGHNRRASPKKGGAGGKGTWGKPGDELDAVLGDGKCHDPRDPAFEAEDDAMDSIEFVVTDVKLDEEATRDVLTPHIKQYLESGDPDDVLDVCQRINCDRFLLLNVILESALDRNASSRELCSKLIADLYHKAILTTTDITRSFEETLDKLEDLKLDDPDASDALGKFVARAVADDCLPPAYVNTHPAANGKGFFSKDARNALRKAHGLLHMHHAMAHLDQVWGVSGARTPVKFVIKQIMAMLKEYLFSEDAEEVGRCIHDLGVPHFHHEVVYEAVVLALEHGHREREPRLIATLLAYLDQSALVTPNQMEAGFRRVFSDFEELEIDIPHAHVYLKRFLDLATSAGSYVSKSVTAAVPQRQARKRYLSENLGGAHDGEAPEPEVAGQDGYASA
eukprot:m.127905 g.127905  ORF g.127905 m.127905 type:complete len:440 (-) comp16719_c4_seq1:14-1333(-)